jgi:hypothetical protein
MSYFAPQNEIEELYTRADDWGDKARKPTEARRHGEDKKERILMQAIPWLKFVQ